jgi:hypothetical protein
MDETLDPERKAGEGDQPHTWNELYIPGARSWFVGYDGLERSDHSHVHVVRTRTEDSKAPGGGNWPSGAFGRASSFPEQLEHGLPVAPAEVALQGGVEVQVAEAVSAEKRG